MGQVVEFPMLEVKAAWREASNRLKDAGIATPLLDSRLLLQEAIGFSYEDLLANPTQKLKQSEVEQYAKLLARRLKREPVAMILGKKPFWKHYFKTTRDTLDPRPDTEVLVDMVNKRVKKDTSPRILELGAGTGALLLSVLDELPNAEGVGVDISDAALEVSRENAVTLGLDSRVRFLKSEWFEHVEGKFDIILSNPPYIPTSDISKLEPEVREFDPHLALDGGKDGLDAYRAILSTVGEHLTDDGFLLLELGQNQQDVVGKLAEFHGFKVAIREKDLSGIIRCLMITR